MSQQRIDEEMISDLLEVLGKESFDATISKLVEQVRTYISELQELFSTGGNVHAAVLASHSLKSTLGQIGLPDMQMLAKELESTCRADEEAGGLSDAARACYAELSEQIQSAIDQLDAYLDSLNTD